MDKSFKDVFDRYDWDRIKDQIAHCEAGDVQRALVKKHRDLSDFIALLSPAAKPFLEEMAQLSQRLTVQRFGKNIQLYAPLYLSNECHNICTYCGFSMDNTIRRRTLSAAEIKLEALALRNMGFQHVLLVAGEANKTVNTPYFLEAIKQLDTIFPQLSIEVQPLEKEDYKALHQANINAVLVYQETYHQKVYKDHHPKGKKSNFYYRLNTPDRIGQAGIHKIGVGVLLGLADWRVDSFFNALHIDYLQRRYWKSKYAVSFPRLRPAEGVVTPHFVMDDTDVVQLICAYRLWNPDLEISLSTREHESFRNHLIHLGITSMSAGSKTNPGGYVVEPASLEQFEISDDRPVEMVVEQIRKMGYQPVWKDWQPEFIDN
ncbi:2-iminoacetate synthase ThiH [Sphingobacterium griseoflavum]|uniref:Thiamine biosynthesis protein ThiH n=1 Tax=Sphingobacterium griseoflavum TaxID=1474952 RepID=A0ABQ3HYS8_9SPHI|nr:2-iminoacetate synthase ThiH [Sphingobacterium griseoflavum]GHE33591.1 thiamine biosynthesis protein ThiH [Sphingobacterium griseoflavum]